MSKNELTKDTALVGKIILSIDVSTIEGLASVSQAVETLSKNLGRNGVVEVKQHIETYSGELLSQLLTLGTDAVKQADD